MSPMLKMRRSPLEGSSEGFTWVRSRTMPMTGSHGSNDSILAVDGYILVGSEEI
jgi:hypothetical protein